jgi:hypothetical protein
VPATISNFLRNAAIAHGNMDAQDYRTAGRDIRALASKMKCTETQEALHLLADAYEVLAGYVKATSALSGADDGLAEGREAGPTVVAGAGETSPSTR